MNSTIRATAYVLFALSICILTAGSTRADYTNLSGSVNPSQTTVNQNVNCSGNCNWGANDTAIAQCAIKVYDSQNNLLKTLSVLYNINQAGRSASVLGDVSFSTTGTYTVTFYFIDSSNNNLKQISSTVTVK